MKVSLQTALSDANLDATQTNSQRQLAISVAAIADSVGHSIPLNLCLILDCSGSMDGRPMETVKQAASRLIERLSPGDRISIVVFDHRAKVLIPNQIIESPIGIKAKISQLGADGGTAIDEGLRLGIEELAKGKQDTVSQAFVLTDGENEHGDNHRCLELAKLAASYNMTLNGLGFGNHWNQDVIEKIADAGGGALSYIELPEQAVDEFSRLFKRIQSVGLTNAHLLLSLNNGVRLAELKPIAQVSPDAIELEIQKESGQVVSRIGDLMTQDSRVILANLYISQLPEGRQEIASVQIRYDDPSASKEGLLSDPEPVTINVTPNFQPSPNPEVQQHIYALAKYRQTQIAETKLQQGDRSGAATMLQTAAKTALQMGDKGAATVLQDNATQLQAGRELSDADRKKTRIVSKTILQ